MTPRRRCPRLLCKGNQAFCKCASSYITPGKGPVCLALDTGDCGHGIEQMVALDRITDKGIKQERVHFIMHIFHRNLEAVEAASLGELDLVGEVLCKVFIHNTIASCKEGKDVAKEVMFIVGELMPVGGMGSQVKSNQKSRHFALVQLYRSQYCR